jgi:hypothetical protein
MTWNHTEEDGYILFPAVGIKYNSFSVAENKYNSEKSKSRLVNIITGDGKQIQLGNRLVYIISGDGKQA